MSVTILEVTEKERESETDRQTDRQTGRQAGRQIDRNHGAMFPGRQEL